jgi:hypothetical protein
MLMRVNQRPKSVESGKKAREIFLEEIDLAESNVYAEHQIQRQATIDKRASMKGTSISKDTLTSPNRSLQQDSVDTIAGKTRNLEIDTNKVTKTFSPTEINYLVHCFKNQAVYEQADDQLEEIYKKAKRTLK